MSPTNDWLSRRQLPSLPALRAVEAAVRLESFTRAAEELSLTQGAVSHLIKGVEAQLKVSLFSRQSRQTIPSPAARRLAEAIRLGLGEIAAVYSSIRPAEPNSISVAVYAGFAIKWLFPRLIRLEERHPGLRLRIATITDPADEDALPADVVIRYGTGRYRGLLVERILGEERMFPVCSPRLLSGRTRLRRPADLENFTLLHDEVRRAGGSPPSWKTWLRRARAADLRAAQDVSFSLSATTLQAAIEGLGVALGRSALVADDLASRRLVVPFGPVMTSGMNYYFVCDRERARQGDVSRLLAWFREQKLEDPVPAA